MTLEEAVAEPGGKVQISGKELRPDGRALLIYSVGDEGAKQLARTRLPEAEHAAKVAELKAQGLRVAETDFKSGIIWVRTDGGIEVYDDKRKLLDAAGDSATLAGGKVVARGDVTLVFSYAEGYEDRGVSKTEAKRRAWATVNKESGGGNKSGSGRGQQESHASSRKGGHKGGSNQSHAKRSAAAKKGWETRRRKGNA